MAMVAAATTTTATTTELEEILPVIMEKKDQR